MSGQKYHVNELVWAKIKTYSWWPAMIVGITPENSVNQFAVNFIGEDCHAFLPVENLAKYKENYEKYSKVHNLGLVHALEYANDIVSGKMLYSGIRTAITFVDAKIKWLIRIRKKKSKKKEPKMTLPMISAFFYELLENKDTQGILTQKKKVEKCLTDISARGISIDELDKNDLGKLLKTFVLYTQGEPLLKEFAPLAFSTFEKVESDANEILFGDLTEEKKEEEEADNSVALSQKLEEENEQKEELEEVEEKSGKRSCNREKRQSIKKEGEKDETPKKIKKTPKKRLTPEKDFLFEQSHSDLNIRKDPDLVMSVYNELATLFMKVFLLYK